MLRIGLLRLAPLGGGLLCELIQDALHFSRIGSGWGQLKVHLIGFCTAGRQSILLRLGVVSGFRDKPLPLEVIGDSLFWIGLDGLVRGSRLCIRIAYLEKDHSFVLEEGSRPCWIGLGGGVESSIRIGNLAGARVDLTQCCVCRALNAAI